MKIHKLKDGDIIKILPTIEDNNVIAWIKKLDIVYVNNYIIYDCKGYLRRISRMLLPNSNILPVSTRYYMNILIDGEIRLLSIGRTLFNLISNNPEILQLKSDYQLNIVREQKMGFPSFDKSIVVKSNWISPVSDMDSGEEWLNWIKDNQPNFTEHLNNNSLFVHKKLLTDYLGKDMLSDLISEDRQKKLEKLGV
jgi:hypothetical protein